MAVVESFELTLLVLESGIIEEVAHEAMNSPQAFRGIESFDNMKSTITNQINDWKVQVKQKLLNKPVHQHLQKEIDIYQKVKDSSDDYFFNNIDSIVNQLDNKSPFFEKAHALMKKQNQKYNPLFKPFFCEQWHQALFNDLQETQLQDLHKEKKKLLEDLYQRQETISQLNEIDNAGNKQISMRLWDMAKAKLSKIDIRSLTKIVNFLNKHSELQNIAEQLGRLANKNDDININNIKVEKEFPTTIETHSNSGELTGLHQSDDLENLLPAELMFLAYPDIEVVFYKHLAEKRLATYQQKSLVRKNNKITSYDNKSSNVEQNKGPFIIAIDASGSMMGMAEKSAKAFAYGLMQIALAEDRQCYVIIFSGQQITYELTKENGLSEMLSFLSYSFHGGTDITTMLEKSLSLMKTRNYENADLIVLSDFIAPNLNHQTLKNIKAMKEEENRFHALSLSKYRNEELLSIFDHQWEYDPSIIASFKRLFY